jgi:hypothetical protein
MPHDPAAPAPMSAEELDYLTDDLDGLFRSSGLAISERQRIRRLIERLIAQARATPPAKTEVMLSFPDIGDAGPLQVTDGRIALPAVTMADLAHRFRMGYVAAAPMQEIALEASFLLDRLSDFNIGEHVTDEGMNLWMGHVEPSISRLQRLIDEWIAQARATPPAGVAVPEGWQDISTAPRDHFPKLVWSLDYGQVVAFLDIAWKWWPVPATEPLPSIPMLWKPLGPSPGSGAAPTPPQGQAGGGTTRYRHRKSNTVYEVIGEATVQVTGALHDYNKVVVYRGEDGALWARCSMEFYDGRFEEIAAQPAVEGGQDQ